jgi:hypothetical protein
MPRIIAHGVLLRGMANLPIQWGAATIAWTPEGHVLRAPLFLDARAALEFEQALPGLVEGSTTWTVQAAVWQRDGSGTKVDPGFVSLLSADLLEQDGVKLRVSLQIAAQQAKEKGDAAQADDDKRIAALLEALRRDDESG